MENKYDADFAAFLNSMVSLDVLHNMTTELDNELKDSQAAMNDIKGMIDALPTRYASSNSEANHGLRQEDLSNFMSGGNLQLLLPDMEMSLDLNLDEVIASMKSYVESIKNNCASRTASEDIEMPARRELGDLELEQCVSSLDQLCRRLSHIKLNKNTDNTRDCPEIEVKLSRLCDDVNNFTKMIQSKTSLSEANKNWPPAPQTSGALDYEHLVNKLLLDIDGVTCLLRSRN